jgi:hypothetical protein
VLYQNTRGTDDERAVKGLEEGVERRVVVWCARKARGGSGGGGVRTDGTRLSIPRDVQMGMWTVKAVS